MRAITRVATPETEDDLLNVALSGTASHVEDAAALTDSSDLPAGTSAPAMCGSKQAGAGLRVSAGTSTPAAAEPELRGSSPDVPAGTPGAAASESERPGGDPGVRVDPNRRAGHDGRSVRAPLTCPAPRTPLSASTGCGQTVLNEASGIHVSTETARRLACDSAMVAMLHGPAGEILDVGRRTRTISPALRRARRARDGQCRFPGCRNVRVDAHHLEHWADGGRTALDNLVLLCRRHHRAVHEEGFRITLDAAGDVEVIRPDGRPLREAPAAPVWTDPPLAPVTARLEQEGVSIDPDTLTPDWRGERLDLDWAIHVLWRPRPQAEAGTDGDAGEDAGQPRPGGQR